MNRPRRWGLLMVAAVLCCCVLSFYQTTDAQSSSRPTLANAPQDRQAMIANLKEIKELLKEQNALLRSGRVKVVVTKLSEE